jgi:hypothetical protein
VIDGAPQVAELAADLYELFIQMPPSLWVAVRLQNAPLADVSGEHRAKSIPPEPDGLVADVNPTFGAQNATLRSDCGYLTYIITTKRMTSSELLKYRSGLVVATSPAARNSARIPLTPLRRRARLRRVKQ